MTWTTPDRKYWDDKFSAYMHDPLDKVFQIQKHEDRSADLLDIFSLQMPNEAHWKTADAIASGFERGQVPSYSENNEENGAINFTEKPVITHPITAENSVLEINGVPGNKEVFEKLKKYLSDTVGIKERTGDYLATFDNSEGKNSPARFMFTHLVLRFLLSQHNVAGLGSLWHRLPADSRFPDHTIWQHNQLTSALYSCMSFKEGSADNAALMLFSITPVQGYIEKARKLRDYWLGSVVLSWLAFEGIRWIIENLGPDHVLYPSLIDQPLVARYLEKEWNIHGKFKPGLWDKMPVEIASFPNKFVALVPANKYNDIKDEIEKHVSMHWQNLSDMVCSYLSQKNSLLKDDADAKKHVKMMFDRQVDRYWDMQCAACHLFTRDDRDEAEKLLHPDNYTKQFETLNVFNRIIEGKGYRTTGEGVLYSVSHSLVQSMLAAKKGCKKITRQHEAGEKCQMCGEFEVLHHKPWEEGMAASEYAANIKGFWETMHDRNSVDFKKNERLCAICTIKRMLDETLQGTDHILSSMFAGNVRFPSTTEFALADYFDRNHIPEDKREKIAQKLHQNEEYAGENRSRIKTRDRYYAILVMDGDKMGDLVNGLTIGSTWETVMHPDIVKRMMKGPFNKKFKDNWDKLWGEKRILTPSIHAAISESLGDFAMYGVSGIVKKHGGRLVYAGGDDVFAVLPLQTALPAARDIREYYTKTFVHIGPDGMPNDADNDNIMLPGKLSLGTGKAEKISISAAIIIAHHKEPLSQLIRDANSLLKERAKAEAGRDACAVELRKRSGGSRYFVRKWDDRASWDAFETLVSNGDLVSNSLVYRLESMRAGIESILDRETYKKYLNDFINLQLERSETTGSAHIQDAAEAISSIIVTPENKFDPHGLIIAGFLSQQQEEVTQ